MTHYYDRGEFKLPSVTTIISAATDKSGALCQWSSNQAVEWIRDNTAIRSEGTIQEPLVYHAVLDEHLEQARFAYKTTSQTALDVGSEVHGAIENNLKGKSVGELSIQAHNAFQAFLSWGGEHNLKPIAIEQTVYGDHWGGTLDFLGYFDGKLYVIDWKSSKAQYPEMRYQVAAYRAAVAQKIYSTISPETEFFWNVPVGCGVLRLDKSTGLPDWKDTSKSYDKDLRIFNRMKDLYFERHPRIAKSAGWKG